MWKIFQKLSLDYSPLVTWLDGNGLQVVVQMPLHTRIFNPILQGEKFDREVNIKKWVPELKIYQKVYS